MDWQFPQTPEGVQACVRQMDEVAAAGDERELAYGMLALGRLLLWVPTEGVTSPFLTDHSLSLRALEIFRKVGDRRGEMKALRFASPMSSRAMEMLDEAEAIALELGDEVELAYTYNRKSSRYGFADKPRAVEYNQKALEILERHGKKEGMAMVLFCLAVQLPTDEESLAAAIRSAELYREVGKPRDASRSWSIATMYVDDKDHELRERIYQSGLDAAQASGYSSQEATFYALFAQLRIAQGRNEEAQTYLRWERDIEESDGLSPAERLDNQIESTKGFVELAKGMGNEEAVTMFKDELKRLRQLKRETRKTASPRPARTRTR